MYTWKTTHSYLHLTKIHFCKTVNYHPNEYSACHISEPRCRKLSSHRRAEGSETAVMGGWHAQQASALFFPFCKRIGTGKGMPERLRCAPDLGKPNPFSPPLGSVFASRMVQFHVVQSRPVPWPILLHYPLAKGVEPVTSIIKCAYRSEIKWQQME